MPSTSLGLYTNNAITLLTSGLSAVATSVSVSTGTGALFPVPSGALIFLVTMIGSTGSPEIAKVTAVTGDTLTLVRGQEGTTARSFLSGDKLELRMTAGNAANWELKTNPADIASLTDVAKGTALIGHLAATTGTTGRTLQAELRDTVKVKQWTGVDPTGATDSLAGIQACINANQTRTIDFGDASNTYLCSGTILLVDSGGHNFQGNLIASGATITFTNTGNATDTDATMARGFQVLPLSAANGNDISGMRNVEVSGFTINCPTNGAGFYIANSQRCAFIKNTFKNGRYSLVMECCINTVITRNTFSSYINAGVGLLMTGDVARVCYNNSAAPGNSYWNDSPLILGNGFSSSVTGGLAHILDHGSQSERIRDIQNNYFYSGANSSTQFGYLSRNSQPKLDCNWFENINYPVRVLSTNASESQTNLPGVTASQPSGTYPIARFVDGYSLTGSFTNNYTAFAAIDYELSGIVGGPCSIASNFYQNTTGFVIKSTQSGNQFIIDGGNVGVLAGGAYKSITYNQYYKIGQGSVSADNAGPGVIGEFITSSVVASSAISLSSGVVVSITSIALTPGDWEVTAQTGFVPAATTNIGYLTSGTHSVSAAFGADSTLVQTSLNQVTNVVNQFVVVPTIRVNISSAQTQFLNAKSAFSTSTLSVYGNISARRIR